MWWVLFGVLAVIGVLYYIGRKVNARQDKAFGQRLVDDIVRMLQGRVNMSDVELRRSVLAMWRQEGRVNFGPQIDRIEFVAQALDSNTIKCSVVVYLDGEAPQRLTADREYSWDYLPNSVSKILIASKDGKDIRILYAKTQNNK